MNRKNLICVIMIVFLSAGSLAAVEIHKTVMVLDNAEEQAVTFWGFTVNDALSSAGIHLCEGDEVAPSLEDQIGEGETVRIARASQVVITADGSNQTIVTTEKIPAQILSLAEVSLASNDVITNNGIEIDPNTSLPYAPTFSFQIRRPTRITLNEEGEIRSLQSTAATLGGALWEAGIILQNADQLTPPSDTPLMGADILATLNRSQEVAIQTQDGIIQARVLAETVGSALSRAGIPLQNMDYSIPSERERIPDDGNIQVVQVREEIILEQDPIPFGLLYQPLPDVELDTQQVVQVGEYGLTARRIRVVYEDGEEVSRTVEDEWVARDPKPRISGYGTNVTLKTVSTPDGNFQYWRAVEAYATSYSPCRLGVDYCSSRTASGATLQKGVIGVIRSWYNVMKGQTVYIPGYGIATIEDVGGGFADRHWVDLGYTDEDWVSWSQNVTVYFLAPVPANIMWILE